MAKKTKDSNLSIEERLEQALIPNWDEPYKLPENWCWTKIGTVTNLYRGVSYKKHEGHAEKGKDDCLVMRGGNIQEGQIDINADNIYVSKELISNEQYIRKHDVVIVSSTGSTKVIGRAGISFADYDDIAFGAFLTLVRPVETVYKPYVSYYFQSDMYRNRMRQLASGVNINNIRNEYITDTPFPMPPLEEQKRIVSHIELLFAKLDEAQEKAQEVVDGFETRKAAILHKAFSGELTAKWKLAHSEICEIWKQKKFSMITHNFDSQRIPLSQAERNNLARTYDYYGASGIIDKVDRFLFEGRKLLIGEDGANLITRSKPIAFIADGQYWVNNHAHVITTTSEMLLDFLCYYINSIDLTPYVTGSAQPKMTQAKMNSIPVPVPSIQEQTEIVRLLDDIISKEQYAKEAAEAVIEQIDTMKKVILARAFRGELGTNDPSEGNAVELLKKVLGGDADVQAPAKKPTKRISIPSDIKELLSNIREEEIIKLLLKAAPQPVSIQEIMSLSSKKFEVMDALRSLEKKQLITKNESGEYSLTR